MGLEIDVGSSNTRLSVADMAGVMARAISCTATRNESMTSTWNFELMDKISFPLYHQPVYRSVLFSSSNSMYERRMVSSNSSRFNTERTRSFSFSQFASA